MVRQFTPRRGGGQGGGSTGIRGAESGWRVRNQGWRGREAGAEGAGVWKLIFYRKFRENGSLRPISHIKVHQGKHAYLCELFCHTTHVMYDASRISA